MKNIHLISTDKPSRLFINPLWEHQLRFVKDKLIEKNKERLPQNIYITSDEEIKEGEWCLDIIHNTISKRSDNRYKSQYKKIILTTDQSLDGVHAIDDEFLQWFVNNPSCEEVKVVKGFADGTNYGYNFLDYKIIIPKEETKNDDGWLSPMRRFKLREDYKQGTMSDAIKQVISNQLKQ